MINRTVFQMSALIALAVGLGPAAHADSTGRHNGNVLISLFPTDGTLEGTDSNGADCAVKVSRKGQAVVELRVTSTETGSATFVTAEHFAGKQQIDNDLIVLTATYAGEQSRAMISLKENRVGVSESQNTGYGSKNQVVNCKIDKRVWNFRKDRQATE